MLKILLLSIVLMALVVLLMGIRIFFNKIFFNKQGKFPITAVGHNPEMKKLGISCVKHDEIKCFTNAKKGIESNRTGCSCS
jgi:hypothetical protein